MIKRKFVFAHMNVATEYAKLSSCQRLKVGALLVKDGTPIAIGYNGTKPGQDNCCEGADGKTLPTVRHAEINALNKLWTTNEKASGAALFVTHAPCIECAQDLFNAGVRDYYFRWHYRDDSGIRFLLKNGAAVHKVLPDIDTIHRLSLRYNLNTDLEIAYDKITEIKAVNEEATGTAKPLEWDYFEAREAAQLQREILQEVLVNELKDSPDWDTIIGGIIYHNEDEPPEEYLPKEGFIPFNEATIGVGSWPLPKKDRQPQPEDTKPANGSRWDPPVRPISRRG
jgi:dCMP deaminase